MRSGPRTYHYYFRAFFWLALALQTSSCLSIRSRVPAEPAGSPTATPVSSPTPTPTPGGAMIYAFPEYLGKAPTGEPVVSGSYLYGMGSQGGTTGLGVIYRIGTDGTGYTILHTFAGGASDGMGAVGALSVSGTTLFGATNQGGTSNMGIVFSMQTDGTGFTILHSFTGSADGSYPTAVSLSGTTLFGTTNQGGVNNLGTVFKMGMDGTGFTVLHEFAGAADGSNPPRGVLHSAGVLYGMTFLGGTNNFGTVFKLNDDGTGFTVLYQFAGGAGGAANPISSFALSGTTLYGTASSGGPGNRGVVFKIETDGTGFAQVHAFTGGAGGGQGPFGAPVLSGGVLFGQTSGGGSSGLGTLYSVNTNGTGFTLLHGFAGGSDGDTPNCGVTFASGVLYGSTPSGGNKAGTLYSITTAGASYTILHKFANAAPQTGATPKGNLTLLAGKLYGMTVEGGSGGRGTIFHMDPDGSNVTVLHHFQGGATDGAEPNGSLLLSAGQFYGLTRFGGTSNLGTVFRINTDGTGFTILRSFAGGVADGSQPYGSLIINSGILYGLTSQGGTASAGTAFSINTDGTGYTLLRSFAGGAGEYNPRGSLLFQGGKLFGTSYGGGTNSFGTLYSMDLDGSNFAILRSFAGGASDGQYPNGTLTGSGTTLYGVTTQGGTGNKGTVFKIETNGTGFTLLYSTFSGTNGGPQSGLLLSGSTLYGLTQFGGTGTRGRLFSIGTDGSGFNTLYNFTVSSTDGANPFGDPILYNNTLYFTTSLGGNTTGTVFKYHLP